MKFSFEAKIYKVGVNPCVRVPARITDHMVASKGYIPIRGKINGHLFRQTLVPVKNEEYRLFVNGPMLKGSSTGVGEKVSFTIEQDLIPRTASAYPMPKELRKKLDDNDLTSAFEKLNDSRRKEILRYLDYLKTDEARIRNIDKVVDGLKKKKSK